MMKEAAAAAAAVAGFLAKLWALVEDSGSDDVIRWSQNGQNFCILDEQRFAKELLPKYFKHNNLSSFIRQLNMYGFRKVIALENGMIMAEKSSVIEFQHPYFKQGKAHLLENIKRKASSMRTEDLKVCTEDLHKVLSEVQEMREQQNNMDVRLANMKRENKALWKEVAVLRQKHSQQQKLLSKILQFILSLMRGNYIVGVKRKRSLTDASGASPSKYSCQYVRIPVENGETVAISGHTSDSEDDNGKGIIIRDVTNTLDSATEGLLAVEHTSGNDGETQAVQQSDSTAQEASPSVEFHPVEPHCPVQVIDNGSKSCEIEKDVVELYAPQTNSPEDPASMIESILNESSSATQSDSLLDREEIQDFLNCIDASLEELQAMLSGKKFNFGSESYIDTCNPELLGLDANLMDASSSAENLEKLPDSTEELAATEGETSGNKDMQVIQYRGNPLLSFLEELPSIESSGKMEDPKDLLLTPLEEKPMISLSSSSEIASSVGAPANQAEPPDILGMGDQPLLSEDANGEYKLFPLLLLSPVANFIEEASEIETT
ncbi:PREDICTED: heat shock factor protein 3-like isoform X2 [Gavialis gangeticus]|uniref:heat shock factor protein 3-like isoform X2 n=1 Tax=Gavialis gangeticus TaxID=94835 RepID=UPI00092F9064|nr:PREDICTED: heat shock factor protein 3-like isoform X2 [Gavialis gangeticus]